MYILASAETPPALVGGALMARSEIRCAVQSDDAYWRLVAGEIRAECTAHRISSRKLHVDERALIGDPPLYREPLCLALYSSE